MKKTIITYGTFDMFHIGHLKLLQALLLSGCNENRSNDAGSENKGEATFNASFVMLFSIK